jgi:hypothetical protein
VIYQTPSPEEPIDQGDLIDGCPVPWIAGFDINDLDSLEMVWSPERVLVLTQACDLANRNLTRVVVAVAKDAESLITDGILKAAEIKGPVRAGRVYGWYFLPKSTACGLPEMVVDLRQVHAVRLDLLTGLCRQGRRRGRIPPLYREHLGKHFGDTYSRIGLPEPYPTD